MNRILLAIPSLDGGGAERVFVHLANHLDRSRFVPVLGLGARRGPYLNDLAEDVAVHEIGAVHARDAILPLVRLVRRIRPDVVLTTLGFNLAGTAARALFPRGVHLIVREGNSTSAFLDHVARERPLRAAFYRLTYRHLYGRADRVICQSEFMARDLVRRFGVDAGRVSTIHNPVDVGGTLTSNQTPALPFEGTGPHLLAIGRLDYQKGYDVLLSAFAALVRRVPGPTLTILGEGDDRQALERQAEALGIRGRVSLPGFVRDPYRYLRAADLFVSSSRYEGMSNVLIEALACGTPVVVTDCPSGNREVVEEGIDGWFAPVDDAEGLARVLERALAGSRGLCRDAIRERCLARFGIDRILPEYETAIERTLAGD